MENGKIEIIVTDDGKIFLDSVGFVSEDCEKVCSLLEEIFTKDIPEEGKRQWYTQYLTSRLGKGFCG